MAALVAGMAVFFVHYSADLAPRLETIFSRSQDQTGSGRLAIWPAAVDAAQRATVSRHRLRRLRPHVGRPHLRHTGSEHRELQRPPGGGAQRVSRHCRRSSAFQASRSSSAFCSRRASLLRRTAKRARDAGADFISSVANALIVGLVGWCVGSMFIETETSRPLWIVDRNDALRCPSSFRSRKRRSRNEARPPARPEPRASAPAPARGRARRAGSAARRRRGSCRIAATSASRSSGGTSRPASPSASATRTPPTSVATIGVDARQRLEQDLRHALRERDVDERVRAAVEREQLGAEGDVTEELDSLRDPELGGERANVVLQRAAADPGQPNPARPLALELGERLHEQQGVLLGLEATNGQEHELTRVVAIQRLRPRRRPFERPTPSSSAGRAACRRSARRARSPAPSSEDGARTGGTRPRRRARRAGQATSGSKAAPDKAGRCPGVPRERPASAGRTASATSKTANGCGPKTHSRSTSASPRQKPVSVPPAARRTSTTCRRFE